MIFNKDKNPSLAQELVAEILYLDPKTPAEIQSAVLRAQDILAKAEGRFFLVEAGLFLFLLGIMLVVGTN